MGGAYDSLTPAASRFAQGWQALAPSGQVGLAVSGGPDSLALLLLVHEVAPRNFSVATVDHGLRPEAAAEAATVADLCDARGIEHSTLTLAMAKGSGVQERARTARYAALAAWARAANLSAIVTAHHADDQAETMVMRLNRGAGVRGLAGMRPVATVPGDPTLALLRPLLAWRRDELLEVVRAQGLKPADDPSNRDQHYERVRIRDALTSSEAFDPKGFAASAAWLADADIALDWAVERLWAGVVASGEGCTWEPPSGLPQTLALRVLERLFATFRTTPPRGPDLTRLLETLRAGGVGTLAGVKADARIGPWRFTRAPARTSKRST
ncbi:tRNA(Ile)-lysidine synthase [Novosphingobium hassiacum]|uniref:tRNA(Ile)-lysidine synthase n=1 Tax=Novosphingobium hassiacum TaxID=173676 RepID=A0A7W5ZTS8_9SPHN|nr:tRNA lysidine(34) synthetase TilS [Novosphingobium hassiacum]MBB3859821.1 tRNA(Ile)-lysidine synthase [Novosphingobium hassiacum]